MLFLNILSVCLSICSDDKLFNSYLLFLSFQLVDLDDLVSSTGLGFHQDSVDDGIHCSTDDDDPQTDDFVDQLLGCQDSPLDVSLEVPECGICTSIAAVNGNIGVYNLFS